MRRLCLLALAPILWGCDSKPVAKPDAPSDSSAEFGGSAPDAGQAVAAAMAEEKRPGRAKPPTMAELKPTFASDAAPGLLPSIVLVRFPEPVVQGGHRKAGKTRVQIEPNLDHSIHFRDGYTMELRLKAKPEPGATYRFKLEALDSRWGLLEAGDSAPSGELVMPSFALASSAMTRHRGRTSIRLEFSARPDMNALREFLKISGDGVPLEWRANGSGSVVEIKLRLAQATNTVGLELTEGLPAADGEQTAPAYASLHPIGRGKVVSIFGMAAVASTDGFGIDVVCHDRGGGNSRRWFWHDGMDRSFRTGPRCQPDANGRASISIDPPQPFRVVPGRGGFRLLGDFKSGKLRVRIASGMTTMDGGITTSDTVRVLNIAPRAAKLEFVETGRYLPRSAWKTLRFKHRNVGEVELEVRQVRPDNLAFWLSGSGEDADRRSSDVIVRRALRVAGTPDQETTGSLDVNALIDSKVSGVLQLTLRAPGAQAVTRLLVTDLNLLAKRFLLKPAKDGLPAQHRTTVWALGAHDHGPQSGVTMELLVPSGRVISQCVSDGKGRCELDGPAPEAIDRAEPMAVVARRGDQITYLRFSDLKLQYNDQHIGGEPYRNAKPYRAFLYGDRDLYRPGETVHLVGAIRGADGRPPKAGLPVELHVRDARSRLSKHILQTNDGGLIELDVPLSGIAPTGAYRVRALVADKSLADLRFNVEEFMPERMRVDVKMDEPIVTGQGPHSGSVEAAYLFGGSAEGSPVRIDCRSAETTIQPTGFDDYSFAPWEDEAKAAQGKTSGTAAELDADGRAAVQCAQKLAGKHPLRLTMEAAVQEAGSGRTTRNSASAIWLPEAYQLGITSGTDKGVKDRPINAKVVLLDLAGKPLAKRPPVTITLYRIDEEYSWGYDEERGRWTYRQRRHLVEEGKSKLSDGTLETSLTPGQDAPRYLLRAQAGQAQADVVVTGSGGRYWWSRRARRADRTPKAERPVQMALELPKQAKVGEPIPASFEAPFAGRALITVETDELLNSKWLDVKAGPNSVELGIDRFAPNVYVNVLLLKDPHLESAQAFVPGRALGLASLTVEPTEQRQDIAIEVPDEVAPNSELPVRIDLGKGAAGRRVTIAAIDQGILSLTKYKTPKPLAAFFAKRRLGVDSFETVGWNLLMPSASPASGKGGGMEGGAAPSRIQPTKPVALWSGLLEVPIDGKLEHRFSIPRYRGELRVMVVAIGPERMGSAEAKVPVREPIVLTTTLPKQLSQGDRFTVPATVTNMSGKAQNVTVTMSAKGIDMGGDAPASDLPLRFLSEAKQTISVADGASGVVRFEAMAMKAIGAATVQIVAETGKLRSIEKQDVPFAPLAPRTRTSQTITLQAGANDLSAAFEGWLPTTERSNLWVTTNPYAHAFGHLDHLVRYPYGCIEQTVSSARPLLFSGLMLNRVAKAEKPVDAMIAAGIDRVFSMQTGAGGFAYWPGGSEPNLWGTAYAVHFLLDAKKQGLAVPNLRLEDAISWLESAAGSYRNHGRYSWRSSAQAYVHYVLARAGRGRTARMKSLLADAEKMKSSKADELRTLLRAGLWLAGDRSHEAALRNPDLSPIDDKRSNDWSFYSSLRGRSLALAVTADLFPNAPELEPLARLVAGRLERTSRHYTTQELSWAITGLGLRAGSGGEIGTAKLTFSDKAMASSGDDKAGPTWNLYRAGERGPAVLTLTGGSGTRYAVINSEGVRRDNAWEVGDRGLSVRRELRRADGTSIDPSNASLKLGQMLTVALTIHNTTGMDQENLALVDRLPAGFEIEAASSLRGFRQSGQEHWRIAHRNSRDDRMELFGRLRRGQRASFVYTVRAVTAGQFRQPPVEAEAMYDPTIWSRQLGGSVRIVGPWQNED